MHGKRSILGRMPGDDWQRFANVRAYYGFMFGHPGKKLMFMGGEFAQEREWQHDHSLDWHLLDKPQHAGVQALVRDLNRALSQHAGLHELDCEGAGFEWLVLDDVDNSVFAWLRKGRDERERCLVVVNFTPQTPSRLSRSRCRSPAPGAKSSTPTRRSMAAATPAMRDA